MTTPISARLVALVAISCVRNLSTPGGSRPPRATSPAATPAHLSVCARVLVCGEPAPGDPSSVCPRRCGDPEQRRYAARHRGLGYEVLALESEACFVPDEALRELDEIVDSAIGEAPFDPGLRGADAQRAQALRVSEAVSAILRRRRYECVINTYSLGDALIDRGTRGCPRHIFDCDIGSLIFLTVAENLGAPVSLVELRPRDAMGHYYVRWPIDGGSSVNWDMNSERERASDASARVMSRAEVIGYAYFLRARLWGRRCTHGLVVADYRQAISRDPEGVVAHNNLAWWVATHSIEGRERLHDEALAGAMHAVQHVNGGNHLDTLACVHAMRREFSEAIEAERQALQRVPVAPPARRTYQERLDRFALSQDCTGIIEDEEAAGHTCPTPSCQSASAP